MVEAINLERYKELSARLPRIEPLSECCGVVLMKPAYVEPLEGRGTLEVDRTCILKCEKCGKLYLSKWD